MTARQAAKLKVLRETRWLTECDLNEIQRLEALR